MTRAELEAFESVVRYGSVTAAAEHIYLSQSALSRRLNALEKELGYSLFVRERGFRAVSLTREGELFVSVCEQLLRAYREAAALPKKLHRQMLHVGAVSSVTAYLMPAVLTEFVAREKQIHLEFSQVNSAQAYRLVESGYLDYALVSDFRYSQLAVPTPAWRQPYVLAAAKGKFDVTSPVSPTQLNPEDEILLPWSPEFQIWHDKWFHGSNPRVTLNHMDLLSAFMTDDAFVVAPYSVAVHLPNCDIYTLQDGPNDRIIYELCADGEMSPQLLLFREYLRRFVARYDKVTLLC